MFTGSKLYIMDEIPDKHHRSPGTLTCCCSDKVGRPLFALFLLPALLLSMAAYSLPREINHGERLDQGRLDANDRNSDRRNGYGDSGRYTIKAYRLKQTTIVIDGKLDEEAWERADVATSFTQTTPDDGQPATEKTEIRVLYDDDALYIGARMYETDPGLIAATLFRRDGSGYSDWIHVGIDSYNDRRTAFVFGVNPRGVKRDMLIYNDNQTDLNWDAVWDAATSIDDKGWIAEFRIPFSQLRYNGSEEDSRSWGINFLRETERNDETAYWSPVPAGSDALVSRSGTLENLRDLPSLRRLELLPYASTRLDRIPGTADNPFINEYGTGLGIGADIKYGINSNITLTATINPDFGQVEVDPAVVNLSAFETFYSERRPFFLEGSEIFSFGFNGFIGMGDDPTIFYSRRIGRAPQGQVPQEARYADMPTQTPIAGAVKLSGKTAGGWSLGMLNALTLEQAADYELPGGQIRSAPVEPLSSYTVLRVKKDLRDGQTVVGFMAKGVYRDLSTPSLEALLAGNAGSAGLDFEHSWSQRTYRINGRFVASHVAGSTEVMQRLQNSSARYYQRPDARHLDFDADLTSIQGFLADIMVSRITRNWITELRHYTISPGFEVNDMGFQRAADRRILTAIHRYEQPSPKGIFQNWSIFAASANSWNTVGKYLFNLHGFGGHVRLRNFWSVNFEGIYSFESYDDRLTRGGPIARSPASYQTGIHLNSDSRKDFRLSAGFNMNRSPGIRDINMYRYVNLMYRPHPAVNLSMQPSFTTYRTGTQYVTTVSDPAAQATYGKRYVFADMDQQTLSVSIRADWTFTPDLSLQLYLQPFISAGSYSGFKELSQPGKHAYSEYGIDTGSILFDEDNQRYEVNPGEEDDLSESFAFENPDFKMSSLRGNAVLRWEFRPGSSLYLVWQQSRQTFGNEGMLRPVSDYSNMIEAPARHIFLVKVSYWMGY